MIKIKDAGVIEGYLYEVWGEDSKLVVYDLYVQAVDFDGNLYTHRHVFKGYFTDEYEGFNHPNFGAKPEAHRLAQRVRDKGVINPNFWDTESADNLADEKINEMWSDYADVALS